jgi:hypothetical protein
MPRRSVKQRPIARCLTSHEHKEFLTGEAERGPEQAVAEWRSSDSFGAKSPLACADPATRGMYGRDGLTGKIGGEIGGEFAAKLATREPWARV